MSSTNELCDFVRETAFAIHRYHKHGHLEKVYENALAHRLRKAGLNVEQQFPLKVFDEDGTPIGEYFADLIIEDTLIVELKTCRALASEHVAQMLGYLRSARREHGLLMNFGGHRFQIRKYAMNEESLQHVNRFSLVAFFLLPFVPFCGYSRSSERSPTLLPSPRLAGYAVGDRKVRSRFQRHRLPRRGTHPGNSTGSLRRSGYGHHQAGGTWNT